MAKFVLGAIATAVAAGAIFAAPAYAIDNAADCEGEGGTMVKVKGSDFCLVPIRPEAYRDEIYDGNQLGVTECPGNKLNDGLYCMYPVTLREDMADAPEAADAVAVEPADMEETADTMSETESEMAKEMADEIEDEAEAMEEAAEDMLDE